LGEEDLLEGLREGRARIGCIEIGADGYLASRTAALSKPYLGDPMNRGKLLLQQKVIADQVKNATNKGFQVMVHAMGDKAVDIALAAIESSEGKGRHRIDPAALLNEDLIARIKKQRVVVSVQPLVAASEFSVYDAEEHLGEERARWLYPLKTLLTQGIRVCGGSDCPMERLSPLLGVQSAVTRRFFPQEQLSVDEALQMYSVNAAYASCDEKERGTIEEGKFADLTVLSKDPHDVPASEIQDIRVEMTIINGKVAYSSSD
jgi:predicted amidohydrolase YtcJ